MGNLELVKMNIVENKNSLLERFFAYIDVSNSTRKEYYSALKMFFEDIYTC